MSDTTAKIRAKGLENTGVTEKYAEQMYEAVGAHYVAVVDLVVADKHGPNLDGKRGVDLTIDSIELAPNDDVAEHIRRLLRAVHYERGLAMNGGDQLPFETDHTEPTVEQVRAAGRAHEADPEADERAAEEHEHDDNLDEDPDQELDGEDTPTPLTVINTPNIACDVYHDGPDALCTTCQLPAGKHPIPDPFTPTPA